MCAVPPCMGRLSDATAVGRSPTACMDSHGLVSQHMRTPCGTRTRNLRIRSTTPCPLGQWGQLCTQRRAYQCAKLTGVRHSVSLCPPSMPVLSCTQLRAKLRRIARRTDLYLTRWPSGQGVGMLSRWGIPAWVRIAQVSCHPSACACV